MSIAWTSRRTAAASAVGRPTLLVGNVVQTGGRRRRHRDVEQLQGFVIPHGISAYGIPSRSAVGVPMLLRDPRRRRREEERLAA